jgi:hypothetical protein
VGRRKEEGVRRKEGRAEQSTAKEKEWEKEE